MSKKDNDGTLGGSNNNITSSSNINVSITPKQYYNKPTVKAAIIQFSEYTKDNLTFTKELVFNHDGWYTYKCTRGIIRKLMKP